MGYQFVTQDTGPTPMNSFVRRHATCSTLDRAGITLSVVCGIHCLLFPLVLLILPLSHEWMSHDQTHYWLFAFVAPIALVSLLRSFFKYKVTLPLALGSIGVGILALSLLSSGKVHDFDFLISLTGSSFLVAAHILNIRSCRHAH